MPGADKERAVAIVQDRLELSADQAVELVERAEEIFLSETKRTQVPERALWLWIDLALVIAREDAAEPVQQVESVKRGDTTIQYKNSSAQKPVAGSIMNRVRTWKVARAR